MPTYVYGYPSKRTYRAFPQPLRITDVVEQASRSKQINIYIHIPFCSYRCTYCTLFLTTRQKPSTRESYVARLVEHIARYGEYFGDREVVSIYFGGGTPTLLTQHQFGDLFAALDAAFPKRSRKCEITVESAPGTFDNNLLECLKAVGVNRMSMGVQSMVAGELAHSGRPYSVETAEAGIEALTERFSHVNLDLIYGLRGQTRDSWMFSLGRALDYEPQTLSLYPVVVRPMTNIMTSKAHNPELFFSEAEKYEVYDQNVALMASKDYRQESFTRFTKIAGDRAYLQENSDFEGTPLLGLGAGARSYFGQYHYGSDYAVDSSAASSIINDFSARPFDPEAIASHGIKLTPEDLARRYVLLGLTLSALSRRSYASVFGRELAVDFSQELKALECLQLVDLADGDTYQLTHAGFKYSSMVARVFYSGTMVALEEQYRAA
ncbi:oxygen-independent coproporphyrinogen-3 oxidase [Bradyrhizobium elkanii]|uniref:coproporphyrinogen-III oxidase family protein n=1 Tax=Bradyrhizobium TaxID=374 RepID=UPI002167154B|nr:MULTISPECIES: radical SAM protein [Bradyrhizobium]MCS3926142.1 oxygen-independent coproporphyrinogen-3 oxidase [Bradyrhizobium elkanii]MCS3966694.1 oxygen-independent coproporphyrinogen-3 oxidase [Bradyrhizobium japonicum]